MFESNLSSRPWGRVQCVFTELLKLYLLTFLLELRLVVHGIDEHSIRPWKENLWILVKIYQYWF
jgi:hypothetical protein